MHDILNKNLFWKTQYGQILRIEEMKTSHIYNCAKMLYNHLAYIYNLPTFVFNHAYSDYIKMAKNKPKKLLKQMCIFFQIIENRNDLPGKYESTYNSIVSILKKYCNDNPKLKIEMKKGI